MNSPESYIQTTPGLFADDRGVTNAGTEEFLQAWRNDFRVFIECVLTVVPGSTPE
jgi:chromate reductase